MDEAVLRQFLNFFQEFIDLCQLESWPDNQTTEAEIKNAFLAAQHIEKCLNRFQKRDILNDFLSTLNNKQDTSSLFIKKCFSEPPKYVLGKIIKSNTKIDQMDVGIRIFLQFFSKDLLERYLTDIMVEAASRETLIKNLSTGFSKDKLLEFKSQLFLSELHTCEDVSESIVDLLQNCSKENTEILIISLLNKDFKFDSCLNSILNVLIQVMESKDIKYKTFWKTLFCIEDKVFEQLFLKYSELFKLTVSVLLDCGKLLNEHMSMEYFYVDLTYSGLVLIVRKILKNENLKIEFCDLLQQNNGDKEFWEKIMV